MNEVYKGTVYLHENDNFIIGIINYFTYLLFKKLIDSNNGRDFTSSFNFNVGLV